MLEGLPISPYRDETYRFAHQGDIKVLAQRMGVDAEGEAEIRDLLKDGGIRDDALNVLDGPFADKRFLQPKGTRFSDGTVKIFYSALDPETAKAEVLAWAPKNIFEGATTARKVYYWMVKCDFEGETIDLRPKSAEWPFLVADTWSSECRQIGTEAAGISIAALLTYSVRRRVGTNLPVFKRTSLANPQYISLWALEYNPADAQVSIGTA